MRILISGSTGLIGRALTRHLTERGHRVVRLVRQGRLPAPYGTPLGSAVAWSPSKRQLDAGLVEGFDAVVHLAGHPVACRWSPANRQRILDSRVQSTELLCETLAQCQYPPRVLISASAVGYYGNREDEWLTEDALPGGDFLADVCRQWEAATVACQQRGVRVVHARFGMVLSPHGGALAQMLPVFRMGLGGRLGHGRQFVSWITLPDCVAGLAHLMQTDRTCGPVNVVAPDPVTNAELTATLGAILKRPALLPVPTMMLRMVFGEMADAVLMASQRVMAQKLRQSGYRFMHEDLREGLAAVLGRPMPSSDSSEFA